MLEDVKGTIEKWFQECVMCGDIARHTPAYNQAFRAKGDLLSRIDTLFQPAADAASEKE